METKAVLHLGTPLFEKLSHSLSLTVKTERQSKCENYLTAVALIFGGFSVEKNKYSNSAVKTDQGTFGMILQIRSLYVRM